MFFEMIFTACRLRLNRFQFTSAPGNFVPMFRSQQAYCSLSRTMSVLGFDVHTIMALQTYRYVTPIPTQTDGQLRTFSLWTFISSPPY